MTDAKKPEPAAKAEPAAKDAKAEQPADLLEADDLFEEFGNEEWLSAKDDEAAPLWEADWDDENVADDFTERLKAELARSSMNE